MKTAPYDPIAGEAPKPLGLNVIHSLDARVRYKSFPLSATLSFGRGDGVDMLIQDDKLSRRHGSIARTGDRFEVIDHGSSNGTFVDGEKIEGTAPLEPGAIVRMGESLFEIGPALHDAGDPLLKGHSDALATVLTEIRRVAATTAAVLVLGETGAGKELVATRVHELSGRDGPFVAVNCAALPPSLAESILFGHKRGAFTHATEDSVGHFERATGGTLFLDEIGTLPLELQPKLLRALETSEISRVGGGTKKLDLRVVAATNVELRDAADQGGFRSDLYARLAVLTLRVPPLRSRRADIPLLVERFLASLAQTPLTVTAPLMEALVLHDWPRNVRELRAVAQHLALRGPLLTAADLPAEFPSRPVHTGGVPSRATIEAALNAHKGKVSEVAKALGATRQQVYRWLEKHGLSADAFR